VDIEGRIHLGDEMSENDWSLGNRLELYETLRCVCDALSLRIYSTQFSQSQPS
jgi:hypothetical protein